MRAVELELAAVGLVGAWGILRPQSVLTRWAFGAVAFGSILAQIVSYPHQWQMYPAIAAILAGVVLLLRLPSGAAPLERRWGRPFVAALMVGACGISLICAYALPIFKMPPPTGPDSIGTRTVHWTDTTRNRELVVQFWYPAKAQGKLARYVRPREAKKKFMHLADVHTNAWQDAPLLATQTPYPVLIFGHMWGGRRVQDSAVFEELASHGYFVISLDHPGNAAKVELANGTIEASKMFEALSNVNSSTPTAIRDLWNKELAVWTADNEFVLNSLQAVNAQPGSWTGGQLDMQKIGAFGHSFGGSSSIRLLGLDPRVKSAVNIDGWTFAGLTDRTAAQQAMFLYEARDEDLAGGMPTGNSVDDQLERGDQLAVRENLARLGGYRVYIAGTQHADFTDATLVSPIQRITWTGPIRPERVRTINRALILAFFDSTLLGKGSIPSFPEVVMNHSTNVAQAKPEIAQAKP